MKKIIALLTVLICFTSVASTTTFLPMNTRSVPIVFEIDSEMMFEKAMSDVREVYVPVLEEEYGKTLDLVGAWDDDTVNAYTMKSSTSVAIRMFGGLFRAKETTQDGFTAVICHEMGHNIGGLPKYARYGYPEWAAAEGQSDYYTTSKCTKKIFREDMSTTYHVYDIAESAEELHAKDLCDKAFYNNSDAAVCYRSAMAGLSLGRLLASFGYSTVSLLTPSQKIAPITNVKGYPSTQCRLDTYFQGALCDNDIDTLASETDDKANYCVDGIGSRPACWYKK